MSDTSHNCFQRNPDSPTTAFRSSCFVTDTEITHPTPQSDKSASWQSRLLCSSGRE